MVIDGETVITGSFNFTITAEENNAENLLVIRAQNLPTKYTANWQAQPSIRSRTREGKGYSETHRADPVRLPTRRAEWLRCVQELPGFHRPDCKSAAKISEKNLIRYGTRDEAIQAGKKPCAECNP